MGMSTADARNALQDQSLTVSVEKKYSNEAKGTVLKQTPRSTLEVPEGTTVELIVAQPLPKVPKVVGKTLANAKRALKNAGFEVGKVTQQTSSKRKGTVISQSPDAGTSARPGRTVSLVTAKPAPQQPSADCQGYSPCIPPGPDVDCAGGEGDGPRFVSGPVQVTGSDPYGLDGDGNGVGCE
ncbi:MAG TPA: PASTA domain-containing protein [Rubrobacter sp.]|nr:PASTA domain-containing protein [Rubrobacter sp.]